MWGKGSCSHICFRLLHETLITCNEGALAAKTMYELLSSYSGEKANEARDDSIRCVAAELKNPDVYLFDHLISLKPVDRLKGKNDLFNLDISEPFTSDVENLNKIWSGVEA